MEKETDKIFDFNVSQYEGHHKMLLTDLQEERQMERYVLIACGIFYSWISTQGHHDKLFLLVASFIPIIIVSLSLIRSRAIFNGVHTQSKYLCDLEAWIYANTPEDYTGPKGWETFLVANKNYSQKFDLSHFLFWYILLGVTLLAPIALIYLQQDQAIQ